MKLFCSICLEDEDKTIKTNCNHTYHVDCLNLLYKNKENRKLINKVSTRRRKTKNYKLKIH